MNIKTTTLRLNLEKADHCKAQKILKSSELSHTKYIVSAILAFAENEKNQKTPLDEIKKIVRSEIGEALKNLNYSQSEIEKPENCETSETSKSEKSENAPMTIFEKTIISPYDENEENDKFFDTAYLESLESGEQYHFLGSTVTAIFHCFSIGTKNRLN